MTEGVEEESFVPKDKYVPKDEYLNPENGFLAEVDVANVNEVIRLISEHKFPTTHLIAVGGTVNRSRRGKPHKDIDLVLYCPEKAIVNDPSETSGFDQFCAFLESAFSSKVGEWQFDKSNVPFFNDYESAGDGKFIVLPNEGKPIEILPIRKDGEKGEEKVKPYKEFIARNDYKSILF